MMKSIATLIDELTVTNIKIFHLAEKMENKKHTPKDTKKLKDLNKYRSELRNALDTSKAMNPVRNKKSKIFADTQTAGRISNGMKKRISEIIDELTVTNIKIFHLVEKIGKNKHSREDAKKAQDLNKYRSKLCNAINVEFKQRENIKV